MRLPNTGACPRYTRGLFTLIAILLLLLGSRPAAQAQTPVASPPAPADDGQSGNWHAQNTDIVQGDAAVPAKYSGPNSLGPSSQVQHTVTADLFAGARLPHDAEAHVDFLMWEGFGLSKTLGIEAFPNSDAYKLGTVPPDFMFARLFVRRIIGFGGKQEDVPDDQLTLASKQDISRLTITAGRYAMTDIFDQNTYASDPHTQFMNWATVGNLAWDYAADSVGYTDGIAAEWNKPSSTLRYGVFVMPKVANGFTGDDQILKYPPGGAYGPLLKSWAMMTELERRYTMSARPGVMRYQAWLNEANMLDLDAATHLLQTDGPQANLSPAQAYRYKYGFGLNWEQEIADNTGLFSRLGWNDGRESGWAYTDVNWTASFGASVGGKSWHRPDDTFGLMDILSGASSQNQAFLKAGGVGILAGDGMLSYSPEDVVETYYSHKLPGNLHVTLDYQFVSDPAFNRDRGPVSILGIRIHWQK
jgi:high affinity Mn2+ porin